MANSIEWQAPTVSYSPGFSEGAFISGFVPPLTPETYDPSLAIEEVEKAEAIANEVEVFWQVEDMEAHFKLELGGDF